MNNSIKKGALFLIVQGLVFGVPGLGFTRNTAAASTLETLGRAKADITVKGIIVDSQNLPVQGVTITVQGTTQQSVSDSKGAYTIVAPDNGSLVFSLIGLKTQTVPISKRSVINLTMEDDIGSLSEVVVTSFGGTRQQRALGYATTTIKSADLTRVATPNLATALYGKSPGVRVQAGAGGATSAVNITVRGINSITGRNQPLIILDGVPIRNEEVRNNDYWNDQRLRGNGLLDINPEDIDNISILKGAAAAALYGSEAVNGVLLITTKKATSGQKGYKVDFSSNFSMDKIAYLPRYQNVRGPGGPREVFNFGQNDAGFITYPDGTRGLPSTTLNFGAPFDGQPIMAWDGQMRPYSAQENNYAALFNDPMSSQVNVAISNATDVSNFRFSLTRQDNEALSLNSRNSKNMANLNASFKVSKKVRTDLMVNYINQNTGNRPVSIDRMINNFTGMMTRFDNGAWYLDRYKTSRGYRFVTGNGQSLTPNENITRNGFLGDIGDYMWRVNEHRMAEVSNRVIGVLTNTIDITKGLTLRARFSTDFTQRNTEDERATERPLAFGTSGHFGLMNESFGILYGDVLLTYKKAINKDFTFSAMAGYTANKENSSTVSMATNGGLSTENLFDLVASSNIPTGNIRRSSRVIDAALGTMNLDYKGFWFVEGTIRRDRTSTMNPNNNAFVYPSVNTALVLSDLITLPKFISYTKLRGSFGVVGNYPDIYNANIAYNQNTVGVQQPGGSSVLFTNIPGAFGNDGIRPEAKHEFEVGIENKFFGGKLGLEVSYYNAQVRDQILPLTLPQSSGASSVLANVGMLRNRGLEIALSASVLKTEKFSWDASINAARNVNVVEKLANNATELLHADYDGNAAQLRSVVGRPMGDFYTRPVETNSLGQKIVQPNGLYKNDPNNWIQTGNAMPTAIGGVINNLRYKNFTLDVLADFQIGGHVMPTGINWMISRGLTEQSLQNMDKASGGISYYRDANGVGTATTAAAGPSGQRVFHDGMLMDGVTANGSPNTNVISQALYFQRTYNWGGPQYSSSRYELYVQENTYFKMRELSFGYSLPSRLAKKVGASNVNLSAFGRNLFFLYRNIKDLDPEVLTGGSRWTQTLTSAGTNPATRTMGIILRANF